MPGSSHTRTRETWAKIHACLKCAHRVIARARQYGAAVLVSGDEMLARKPSADGVRSTGAHLRRPTARPATRLWEVSCHNAEELARADTLGADFVVLSPVLPTARHPGEPGMGWARFAELTRGCPLPVYALGGMQSGLLDTTMHHGAHGTALMSGIW